VWLCNDVAILHVKIDNLNASLMRFCFIRSIDRCIHLLVSYWFWMHINFFKCLYKCLLIITVTILRMTFTNVYIRNYYNYIKGPCVRVSAMYLIFTNWRHRTRHHVNSRG
jgi:hypothetical protein